MDLASAGASDRFFVFQLAFDPCLACCAILAHQVAASTSRLIILQRLAGELEVPFGAAFLAGIRVHIPWAEATCLAAEADCLTLLAPGVLQHFVVELGSGQRLFASVAPPGICLALACDALVCVALEGSGVLVLQATGASLAGNAP